MAKYSKTKLKIHPKEGLEMETYATPLIKNAIAFAIVCLGLTLVSPFIYALANFILTLRQS